MTAHPEHTLAAFELAAFDYLLKPVTAERLARTLSRLVRREGRIPTARQALALAPPAAHFPVRAGEGLVFLELRWVSHFELAEGQVWAWSAGERYRTSWTALAEIEEAHPGETFCRIQRHLLLRPGAVLGLQPLWGRRVLARIPGNLDLEASRAMTARLKELLGV